ncbi:MAG: hypothetical protein A2075_15700 [Geobacteraceae bacterium GWC2_58_44]|nr:MAG: hypothetical protein A2075_15700 [Geobacteraceae bacterium GWC2_58_44]HBG06029.1 class I SAM-dependent methyltransferase [Geobacter sp.]
MTCPICAAATGCFGTATVLQAHLAEYRQCKSCGFLFVHEPAWLDQAYASAITREDLGLVQRNLWLSGAASSVVSTWLDAGGRFLDYGGGTGLFTRLMRDAGFDWYWYDPFCHNLFAQGYAAEIRDGVSYELLTAAEIFEHLVDPVAGVAGLTALSSNIIFTTQLLPDPPPPLDQWWYYGLEHGQHVSFYSRKSLKLLGERFGLELTSNGDNLHMFSKKAFSELLFKLVTTPLVSALVSRIASRRSLLPADFQRAREGQGRADADR